MKGIQILAGDNLMIPLSCGVRDAEHRGVKFREFYCELQESDADLAVAEAFKTRKFVIFVGEQRSKTLLLRKLDLVNGVKMAGQLLPGVGTKH